MELTTLQPFGSRGTGDFIRAGAQVSAELIELEYILGEGAEASLPAKGVVLSGNIPRQHELWKKTCFEAFLAQQGGSAYYEINLSPWGAWNAYLFQSYRNPKLPVETLDLQIAYLEWGKNRLYVKIKMIGEPQGLQGELELSLSAVLVARDQPKPRYYAIKHCGESPDFHLRESFCLSRGSK